MTAQSTPAGRGLDGLGRLMTLAFRAVNLRPLAARLIARAAADEDDADALMDLSIVLQLQGLRELGTATQGQALTTRRLYELRHEGKPRLRLLAIMAPGDLMTNTPLEFLVADSDIALSMLYLDPDAAVPAELPAHDAVFIAVAHSEAALPLLDALAAAAPAWGERVLNGPARIPATARTRAFELLGGTPALCIPATVRSARTVLEDVASGALPLRHLLAEGAFPIIVRPVDSHAGRGLSKIDAPADLAAYLDRIAGDEFFVSPFVDYRSADGQFRKYRIVLIDGVAYPVHMAISDDWMIHYLNAGMVASAAKRTEEARFMDGFRAGFGVTHASALRAIGERLALDYLVIDCGETKAGELLVFEVCTGAVVHAMDPVEVFPYKRPHMAAIFAAFRALVHGAAAAEGRAVRLA